VPGRFSTVTVVGPHTTRDLALPDDLPAAELLPELLRHTGGEVGDGAVSWAVSTPDGTTLDAEETLGDKDIADGSVLLVHDATASALPDTLEDVRDGVEDAVDDTRIRWEPATGRLLAVATAGLLVAASAFSPGSGDSLMLTGGIVCLLAVLMAWWSTRQDPLLTHLALIGGCLWAGRIGYTAVEMLAPDGSAQFPTRALGALAAALILAVVARAGASLATVYAVGLGVVLGLGGLAWSLWTDTGLAPVRVAALAALAAIFAFALAPRIAMFSAGMFSLDRIVRGGERTGDKTLRDHLDRTDARITGAVFGLAAVAGAASALLSAQDELWAHVMGTGTAVALLTRTRIFELVRHVAPVRLIGMAATAWTAWNWLTPIDTLMQWLPALGVLSGLIYVSIASISRSSVSAAWWRRVIGITEIVLVAGLVVCAGELLGLYAMVAGI
jgi:type VII secretion integral membrane protein EccD